MTSSERGLRDDPIVNVASGWRRAAEAVRRSSDQDGFCAATWHETSAGTSEVAARANAHTHVLAFTTGRLDAQVRIDGDTVFEGVAPPGSCNLVQPGQRPSGAFHGPWRLLHLYLPDRLLRRVVERDGWRAPPGSLELINPCWTMQPGLRRIAREVDVELRADRPFGRLKMDALGLALAVELLRGHSTVSRPDGDRKAAGLARWQVERVCEAMDAALDGDPSLRELAAVVGLSESHLSRAFHQATGRPPFRWLAERRIERAKVLLSRDEPMPLCQVALACGFGAQPAFTTAFRRATGTTPGQWRRERIGPGTARAARAIDR